jgi:hypothetical protein
LLNASSYLKKRVERTFRDQVKLGYKKEISKILKVLEKRMGTHTRSLKFALVGCEGDATVH